ncbi:MAG: S8 family peptidase, partial [Acholeplasmataceae bacterium]|nr:S8 family peptidase [Acholeplasmataceae bacterium]
MKKTLITFAFLVLIFTSLFSQENYYWSNGKKVKIKEDKTSMVIYEKKNKKLSLLKNSNIENITEKSSQKLGTYIIVRMRNLDTDILSFNEKHIKAKKSAYIAESGDTLYPTNYIILKFKVGNTLNDIEKILIKHDVTLKETKYHVVKLEVSDINNVFNAANEIYESGLVEWCRPNFIRKFELHLEPRDKQYYIHNTYHYCGAFDNDINAIQAWAITTGCKNIRVAVLDDGVENHTDLRDGNGNSRVINGYSVPGVPANGRPSTTGKHGQAYAGIIAASHSNNIRGIAPNVLIVPVNLGFDFQDEDEWFDAMNWAWEPDGGNADVLSNSWGPSYGAGGNELFIEAINNAQTFGRGGDFENNIPGLGSIVVFSSGNNGLDEVSDYAKVAIAVGAIDKEDTPAKGLNGNKNTRYTNIGSDLDLVAYGGSIYENNGVTDIRSIDREGANGYEDGNYTDHFGGTSAACPMVSGAAALILSINPNLTRTQVENILFSTATDLGAPGRDDTYGHGKLNIYAACKAAVETRTNSFILNKGYLTHTIFRENFKMSFVGSPGCGIASGIYLCDVYKLEATIPQNSIYIGDGLSGANPNTGEYYVNIANNGSNIDILTFFYYVRTNSIGQTVNTWVPHSPANLWSREYLYFPPENISFNGVVNSGESKELLATKSITLTPGFHAKEGSSFHATRTSTSEDITCLPNPTNIITLKSDKIGIINEDGIKEKKNTSISQIDKIENIEQILIYPNPNKGNFTINIQGELSNNAKVEIYSSDGSLKYSSAIVSKQQNIVFTQTPGIYL